MRRRQFSFSLRKLLVAVTAIGLVLMVVNYYSKTPRNVVLVASKIRNLPSSCDPIFLREVLGLDFAPEYSDLSRLAEMDEENKSGQIEAIAERWDLKRGYKLVCFYRLDIDQNPLVLSVLIFGPRGFLSIEDRQSIVNDKHDNNEKIK